MLLTRPRVGSSRHERSVLWITRERGSLETGLLTGSASGAAVKPPCAAYLRLLSVSHLSRQRRGRPPVLDDMMTPSFAYVSIMQAPQHDHVL
ncbi:hypothetical protein NDU88_007255 [Pleurodeles waltl]|uniref:Uncharacterized protein n=1 Tax=Pleurodeles waltl TaxID=8319 RepID=A0AAV7QL92_PLEWA|nr:hypothetical protein NDU88_007255 [Pleurodeles waltl]